METWDVFISHASEDKKTIVEPLVKVLEENGISCWYDDNDIDWGDSLADSISNGLKKSKYVLVVLSETFLIKGWAKAELNAMLNMEFSNGQKKVLPLIVGDEKKIIGELPLLGDKKYLIWDKKSSIIVNELKKILKLTVTSNKIIKNKDFILKKSYFIILVLIMIGIFSLNNSSLITVLEKKSIKLQFYKLKEEYKDYPELIKKAETIQKSSGYYNAVDFFMKINLENLTDEVNTTKVMINNGVIMKNNNGTINIGN